LPGGTAVGLRGTRFRMSKAGRGQFPVAHIRALSGLCFGRACRLGE
jgi:hypothetical protein